MFLSDRPFYDNIACRNFCRNLWCKSAPSKCSLIARKAREQHDNIKKKAETWKETSVFNKTLGSVICMSLFWSRTPSHCGVCGSASVVQAKHCFVFSGVRHATGSQTPSNLVVCCSKIDPAILLTSTVSRPTGKSSRLLGHLRVKLKTVSGKQDGDFVLNSQKNVLNMFKTAKNMSAKKMRFI